jgi:hypothetical protein
MPFLIVLGQDNLDKDTTLRILLEVKKSFVQDPENVLTDWSEDNTDYCSWRGVSCGLNSLVDDSVNVVGLNLSDSSLTGSISPELGRLKNLLHLDLSSNNLVGPIPTNLSNLVLLESLLLFSNQLNGSVPTEFGLLTSLRVMRLGDNGLTGMIPASLGKLVNLVNLALASCELTGSIPREHRSTQSLGESCSAGQRVDGSDSVRVRKLLKSHCLHCCKQQTQWLNS